MDPTLSSEFIPLRLSALNPAAGFHLPPLIYVVYLKRFNQLRTVDVFSAITDVTLRELEKSHDADTLVTLRLRPDTVATPSTGRLSMSQPFQTRHLQVAHAAFVGAQAPQDEGIVGIEVGDELAGQRGDLQSHVHSWAETFVLHPDVVVHVLKLGPVQLRTDGTGCSGGMFYGR